MLEREPDDLLEQFDNEMDACLSDDWEGNDWLTNRNIEAIATRITEPIAEEYPGDFERIYNTIFDVLTEIMRESI